MIPQRFNTHVELINPSPTDWGNRVRKPKIASILIIAIPLESTAKAMFKCTHLKRREKIE
jgi:hypothetical protein